MWIKMNGFFSNLDYGTINCSLLISKPILSKPKFPNCFCAQKFISSFQFTVLFHHCILPFHFYVSIHRFISSFSSTVSSHRSVLPHHFKISFHPFIFFSLMSWREINEYIRGFKDSGGLCESIPLCVWNREVYLSVSYIEKALNLSSGVICFARGEAIFSMWIYKWVVFLPLRAVIRWATYGKRQAFLICLIYITFWLNHREETRANEWKRLKNNYPLSLRCIYSSFHGYYLE